MCIQQGRIAVSEKNVIDSHIIGIIQKEAVREQSDLQNLLKNLGYDVPQATLSRRLKKLNIVKIGGFYKIIDFVHTSIPLVVNMQVSEYGIIVLHTHPGSANNLAAYIDHKYVDLVHDENKNSGILGTLAGDDTVLVITKDKKSLETVKNMFYELFAYLKNS
jgi:transcriptional regulator of arginine metabolism